MEEFLLTYYFEVLYNCHFQKLNFQVTKGLQIALKHNIYEIDNPRKKNNHRLTCCCWPTFIWVFDASQNQPSNFICAEWLWPYQKVYKETSTALGPKWFDEKNSAVQAFSENPESCMRKFERIYARKVSFCSF
jgi:hypothetical protein